MVIGFRSIEGIMLLTVMVAGFDKNMSFPDFYIIQLKLTTTCINVQITLTLTVTTVGRTEDNTHLFTKCTRIKRLSTHYYEPILTKLAEKTNTPQEHLSMLNVKNSPKHTTKLTLTIIQIILHKIWESRNNKKYDKKITTTTCNNNQNKRTTTTHSTTTLQTPQTQKYRKLI